MFHTYVKASSGRQIDVDRAALLMDRDLLREATAYVQREPAPAPAQEVEHMWLQYCVLHKQKYGEPFEPDVSMTWDT